jgi:hypothetical protein
MKLNVRSTIGDVQPLLAPLSHAGTGFQRMSEKSRIVSICILLAQRLLRGQELFAAYSTIFLPNMDFCHKLLL